jgi:hypothetical protein
MPVTYEPDITVPDVDALASGDGPSFRRILVPIRQAGDAAEALAVAARVCRSAGHVQRHVRYRSSSLLVASCHGSIR